MQCGGAKSGSVRVRFEDEGRFDSVLVELFGGCRDRTTAVGFFGGENWNGLVDMCSGAWLVGFGSVVR
jgi:hypothetical protein